MKGRKRGKKEVGAKKLYKKFAALPKKVQNEFEDLHEHLVDIRDEETRLALELIYPTIMKRFLEKYNKIRERELKIEKKISSFGKKYGFTLKQLFMVRRELGERRFQEYLKKRSMK